MRSSIRQEYEQLQDGVKTVLDQILDGLKAGEVLEFMDGEQDNELLEWSGSPSVVQTKNGPPKYKKVKQL